LYLRPATSELNSCFQRRIGPRLLALLGRQSRIEIGKRRRFGPRMSDNASGQWAIGLGWRSTFALLLVGLGWCAKIEWCPEGGRTTSRERPEVAPTGTD
jgi:hypothetical protein